MQTSTSAPVYAISYLTPALLWQGAVVLVIPALGYEDWIHQLIPQLQASLGTSRAVVTGDRFPAEDFTGLFLTTPQVWLREQLGISPQNHLGTQTNFPLGVPTLIDGADDLELWAREILTQTWTVGDWDQLLAAYPQQAEMILDVKVRLTKNFFDRPPNPYGCCLLEPPERELIQNLAQKLPGTSLGVISQELDGILWAAIDRQQGYFTLHSTPAEVASSLSKVWQKQPVVFMGRAMDLEVEATVYRQNLGLGGLTCLKFPPDSQTEMIQLYLPDKLPLPNTPQFQGALEKQVLELLTISSSATGLTVILVEDRPLKQQMAAIIAAEFGSRVQMEVIPENPSPILVTGWQFWRESHYKLPAPKLLIMATLPIPSLENPLVAGQVAYYKKQRLDWFRLYLLPTALRELQGAIAPVRLTQGVVAMLDSRVNHRSYGQQVLTALSPFAKINYLDPRFWELLS